MYCFRYTAFLLAKDVKCAELLLKYGCNKEAGDGQSGNVVNMAAYGKRADLMKVYLEHGISTETEDLEGYTAILIAASMGYAPNVKLLVNSGCDINNMKNSGGDTALMEASKNGYANCIAELLLGGADIRLIRTFWRDREKKENALDLALQNEGRVNSGQMHVVNLLYAAGGNSEKYVKCVNILEKYPILNDLSGLQSLKALCRRFIKGHMLGLDVAGIKKFKNLFLAMSELPLPKQLGNYLLYNVDIHEFVE